MEKLQELLYDSKIKYIAMVLNTDTCQNSGQHWLVVLIKKKEKEMEIFNSSGYKSSVNVVKRIIINV